MNSFKQFLMQEAIALSTIRAMYKKTNMWMVGKYSKVWKAHKEDNPLNTNKRLYFPLVKGAVLKSDVEKQITGVLVAAGYTVVDYLTGELSKEGDKNKYKIGRVLTKLGKQDLVKAYQTDLNNLTKQSSKEEVKSQSGKEMMIVICRHFVDYIQQTEGRKWMADSCKGITNGYTNNHSYLPMEFVGGWLVAYLCDVEDVNLKNPLARVLIIPFIKERSSESRLYVADENTYGTGVSGWTDRVNQIIDDIGLRKQNSYGKYTVSDNERKDGYVGTLNTDRSHTPSISEMAKELRTIFEPKNVIENDTNIDIYTTDEKWVQQYFDLFFPFYSGPSVLYTTGLTEENKDYISFGFNNDGQLKEFAKSNNLKYPEDRKEADAIVLEFLNQFEDDIITNIETRPTSINNFLHLLDKDRKGTPRLHLSLYSGSDAVALTFEAIKTKSLVRYLKYRQNMYNNTKVFNSAFKESFWVDPKAYQMMVKWFTKKLGKSEEAPTATSYADMFDKDMAIFVTSTEELVELLTAVQKNTEWTWSGSATKPLAKNLDLFDRDDPESVCILFKEGGMSFLKGDGTRKYQSNWLQSEPDFSYYKQFDWDDYKHSVSINPSADKLIALLKANNGFILQTEEEHDSFMKIVLSQGYRFHGLNQMDTWETVMGSNSSDDVLSISLGSDKYLSYIKRDTVEDAIHDERDRWGVTCYVYADIMKETAPKGNGYDFEKMVQDGEFFIKVASGFDLKNVLLSLRAAGYNDSNGDSMSLLWIDNVIDAAATSSFMYIDIRNKNTSISPNLSHIHTNHVISFINMDRTYRI